MQERIAHCAAHRIGTEIFGFFIGDAVGLNGCRLALARDGEEEM